MRRVVVGLVVAVGLLVGVSGVCAEVVPVSVADRVVVSDYGTESVLIMHYHRPDGVYEGWNVWSWAEGGEGGGVDPAGETDYGPYFVIPVEDRSVRSGFLLRKNEWETRDVGMDRFVTLSDSKPITEVWLVSGDNNIYTTPARVDLTTKLVAAFLDGDDRIRIAATGQLTQRQRTAIRIATAGENPSTYSVSRVERTKSDTTARIVYDLHLTRKVLPGDVGRLQLTIPEFEPRWIYARGVLDSAAYLALDAELGHRYSAAGTDFAVWSPVSVSAELLLYDALDAREPSRVVPMEQGERGVWAVRVEGDLQGKAYVYRFVSYGQERIAADINTYAATFDSRRSVVIDLDRTDPEGWGLVANPVREHQTDEVIYEIHVRDYSVADASCPEEHRGTYLGLIHENPAEGDGVSTGVDHLLDLGVTAVHLLPIHDFSSAVGEYNWGYWTALFNLPESNYATDVYDPMAGPSEFKQMVSGLHGKGIRVILDVVYNHTSSSFEFSPFHQTVPNYYFRTGDDGLLLNDAGVGNSVADERLMVRKYIVDSLVFWVNEYRVDGFRFDLLGTHHPETVEALCEALLAIREDLTLYGEPWTGGGPTHFPKGAQRGMAMAVFNDHYRNAIRGDLDGKSQGFANGKGGNTEAIREGVAGGISDFADEPTESVNYVSAHDNRTYWDKLEYTLPKASDADKRAMQKLALGMVLTSQGVAFLHGGSDFARTKGGHHNSYNAGDAVNRFDWDRKAEYRDVYAYVRGLIAIRRAHPAFRIPDSETVRRHIHFLQLGKLFAFELDGAAVGDSWSRIIVAYNGEPEKHTLPLPEGTWSVMVDAASASADEPLAAATGEIVLPAWSMVVVWSE
ncbi:Pullulanase precursor [Mucisphaera calidilacus]|uniref:pullulanase n=2 Tax=Mucisphaera calidilacus TaxID=2527982 RepID=A0A518BTX5_9BACT|nr:Pullulanase precursor [Mucisphaera calidilacus]